MHKYDVECECDVCVSATAIARVMLARAERNGIVVTAEARKYLLQSLADGGKPSQWELEQWLKGGR